MHTHFMLSLEVTYPLVLRIGNDIGNPLAPRQHSWQLKGNLDIFALCPLKVVVGLPKKKYWMQGIGI